MNRTFAVFSSVAALTVVSAIAWADPPAPPPEAFDACASSKEKDACTVKFGSHEIAGTCEKFPGRDALACRPSGPPPGPPPNQ